MAKKVRQRRIRLRRKIYTNLPHKVPADLRKALVALPKTLAAWEDLTPLARNEWICWITFVKKDETRKDHVKRTIGELKEGMHRPCCWLGCIHRKDKQLSPSQKFVFRKRSSK